MALHTEPPATPQTGHPHPACGALDSEVPAPSRPGMPPKSGGGRYRERAGLARRAYDSDSGHQVARSPLARRRARGGGLREPAACVAGGRPGSGQPGRPGVAGHGIRGIVPTTRISRPSRAGSTAADGRGGPGRRHGYARPARSRAGLGAGCEYPRNIGAI
jgi:hypothetical protein